MNPLYPTSRVACLGTYRWIWLSAGAQRNLRRKREPYSVPLDIHALNALLRASFRELRPRDGHTPAKSKAEAARASLRHNEGMRTRTLDEVTKVLGRVSFAPSCIDMGWLWEVQELIREGGGDHGSRLYANGFLIRTTFKRPDRDSSVVSTGVGAWHHVPPDADDSAIVKRAFVAAKMILEHELLEAFHVDGVRLFDPHHTIDDLCRAAERKLEAGDQ